MNKAEQIAKVLMYGWAFVGRFRKGNICGFEAHCPVCHAWGLVSLKQLGKGWFCCPSCDDSFPFDLSRNAELTEWYVECPSCLTKSPDLMTREAANYYECTNCGDFIYVAWANV